MHTGLFSRYLSTLVVAGVAALTGFHNAEAAVYDASVTAADGTVATLLGDLPIPAVGNIVFTGAAPTDLNFKVGGFFFSSLWSGDCDLPAAMQMDPCVMEDPAFDGTAVFVPVTAIDPGTLTVVGGIPTSGAMTFNAFSPTFGIPLGTITLDVDSGGFTLVGALGGASGPGVFVAAETVPYDGTVTAADGTVGTLLGDLPIPAIGGIDFELGMATNLNFQVGAFFFSSLWSGDCDLPTAMQVEPCVFEDPDYDGVSAFVPVTAIDIGTIVLADNFPTAGAMTFDAFSPTFGIPLGTITLDVDTGTFALVGALGGASGPGNFVADSDGDGVDDSVDNCTEVANPTQCDGDGDGYGNRCDADLNNSGGIVNFADLSLFGAAFGTVDADADLDCTGGIVNFGDLSVFVGRFGQAPGPSALVTD